jgi:hypothetical protein
MRTRRPRPAPIARSAFTGFRFPPDVIVVAVRWYLRFGLSYRDIEELLAERGIPVDHVTIYRWVVRFTPLLADAARPCRRRPQPACELVASLPGWFEPLISRGPRPTSCQAIAAIATPTSSVATSKYPTPRHRWAATT